MMLPKKTFFAGAMGLAMAAPAMAEEHVVILTGFSYFPAVTYAQPGDDVRFVNESGDTETVVGKDVGWVIGPLNDGEDAVLTITEETELAFFSSYTADGGDDGETSGSDDDTEEDYGNYEDATIKAEISFEVPELNVVAPDD